MNMLDSKSIAAVCSVVLAAICLATPVSAGERVGVFEFDGWQGPAIRVFYTQPARTGPSPVVFVMHGVRRNADEYRDQWQGLAEESGFLLIVPEFNQQDFPGANAYNLGYVFDEEGRQRPREKWSFSAIEPIFDDVRKRFETGAERYSIYGHSAGGQFVHRFLMHVPGARIAQAVAANAGWYTLPDSSVAYPYGLNGSVVTDPDLAAALQLPVTLLLGDRDYDSNHASLRHTPQADAQGLHRLARGFTFYDSAQRVANRLSVPFNWHLATVSGADHDNTMMAPAAVAYLLKGPVMTASANP